MRRREAIRRGAQDGTLLARHMVLLATRHQIHYKFQYIYQTYSHDGVGNREEHTFFSDAPTRDKSLEEVSCSLARPTDWRRQRIALPLDVPARLVPWYQQAFRRSAAAVAKEMAGDRRRDRLNRRQVRGIRQEVIKIRALIAGIREDREERERNLAAREKERETP